MWPRVIAAFFIAFAIYSKRFTSFIMKKLLNEEILKDIIAEAIASTLAERKVIKLPNQQPAVQEPQMQEPQAPVQPMNNTPTALEPDETQGGMDNDMAINDMPMDADNEQPQDNAEDDSTMSIINQLSPEDREAVRSYAQSILSKADAKTQQEHGNDNNADNEQPVMESITFKKGQIRKINEIFGMSLGRRNDDVEEKPLQKKRCAQVSQKSPFSSPKFE